MAMRQIISFLALTTMMCAASAQTATPPRTEKTDLPFRLVSAEVQRFERAVPSRKGDYREALVLKIDAAVADYEALPPAKAAFLYVGGHELRPIDFQWGKERVIVTFHDPQWRELRGGEPMVLTTNHGEPQRNPEKYREAQRFDREMIRN
jgi:hypothetical protein